jgi:hypothetical protein
MQLALIRQWQTVALLLFVLAFALGPVSLPGYILSSPALDWLFLIVPFSASVVSMRLGWHRLAAVCGAAAGCLGALLFWWMLSVAVSALLTVGLTSTTLAAGLLAAALIGTTATMSGASGSLWRLPESRQARALGWRRTSQLALPSNLER